MAKTFIELSTYDRIQALVRNKQYLKELGKAQSKAAGTERNLAEEKLRNKYGLVITITVEFAGKYGRERLGDTMLFEDVNPVVAIMPAGKFEPSTETVTIRGEKTILTTLNPQNCILRKGRFLNVEIDLKAKDKDIDRLLKKRISSFKGMVDKTKSHAKEGEYDPWEIWDLHKKKGLSLVEIARRKSGIKGHPTYNEKLRKHDAKVRRAYQKACSMIDSIHR